MLAADGAFGMSAAILSFPDTVNAHGAAANQDDGKHPPAKRQQKQTQTNVDIVHDAIEINLGPAKLGAVPEAGQGVLRGLCPGRWLEGDLRCRRGALKKDSRA